jgi:hypothetical protein
MSLIGSAFAQQNGDNQRHPEYPQTPQVIGVQGQQINLEAALI